MISRPTLVFGKGDLLLNNMAWALRRFPVFPVFGSGEYQVQPIYAEDLATKAVAAGSQIGNSVADAAGPETFTFEELLRLLASAVGVRVRLVHTAPSLGFTMTQVVGLLLGDVVLTRDEVDGLMAGLLTSNSARNGAARFSRWLSDYGDSLGRCHVWEPRGSFHRGWPFGDVTGNGMSLPCRPHIVLLTSHGKGLACIEEPHESGYIVWCG